MHWNEVVFVTKAKEDLASGGWIEVECIESAHANGSELKGKWCFAAVAKGDDGNVIYRRIVTRREADPKMISTFKGLGSFAIELGIDKPEMPMSSGFKGIWKRETKTGQD